MLVYFFGASIAGLLAYKIYRRRRRNLVYDAQLIQITPTCSLVRRFRVSPCVSVTPERLVGRPEFYESPVLSPLSAPSLDSSSSSDLDMNCYFQWDGRQIMFDHDNANLDSRLT